MELQNSRNIAEVGLENSWLLKLNDEFNKPYMLKLFDFIKTEIKLGKIVYPHPKNYFAALNMCSFEATKVIILGQDPYHGEGQAHGLSFSVQESVKLPPSLKNIFKELETDLRPNWSAPKSGDLSSWAKQGVLLLNTTMTVERSKPGSHQKKGWETFTDVILQKLSDDKRPKVFILWGAPAIKKTDLIDAEKHHVLQSVHPSPLSSYRGFFGSRPFSKANEFLIKTGQTSIDWRLG